MTSLLRRALVVGAFLVGAIAAPAVAQEIFPIVFPVDGPYDPSYDNFGDCRAGCIRTHEGADIMADKMVPVVAAADGFVIQVRGISSVTGSPEPGGHQWLVIDHGGWQTRYLHLNNDTPGSDDGVGLGVSDDIIAAFVAAGGSDYGTDFAYPVSAGQLVGWVGDSGNAEDSGPHLHFELRVGEGWDAVPVDPYPSLVAAAGGGTAKALWNGVFSDDDGSPHEGDIEKLAAEGTTKGCNPPANTMFCPERLITRGEISAFIRRTLNLPATAEDHFTDDAASIFEGDINAVAAAGIGFGCTEDEFCPDEPLLREEMAEMLVRAFADHDAGRYSNPDGIDYFTDDEASEFQESINLLMAAGVTKGCNPPDNDNFCPDRPLIRAELASFFVRALGL